MIFHAAKKCFVIVSGKLVIHTIKPANLRDCKRFRYHNIQLVEIPQLFVSLPASLPQLTQVPVRRLVVTSHLSERHSFFTTHCGTKSLLIGNLLADKRLMYVYTAACKAARCIHKTFICHT